MWTQYLLTRNFFSKKPVDNIQGFTEQTTKTGFSFIQNFKIFKVNHIVDTILLLKIIKYKLFFLYSLYFYFPEKSSLNKKQTKNKQKKEQKMQLIQTKLVWKLPLFLLNIMMCIILKGWHFIYNLIIEMAIFTNCSE